MLSNCVAELAGTDTYLVRRLGNNGGHEIETLDGKTLAARLAHCPISV
jgi:hypothetical protein